MGLSSHDNHETLLCCFFFYSFVCKWTKYLNLLFFPLSFITQKVLAIYLDKFSESIHSKVKVLDMKSQQLIKKNKKKKKKYCKACNFHSFFKRILNYQLKKHQEKHLVLLSQKHSHQRAKSQEKSKALNQPQRSQFLHWMENPLPWC